VRAWLGLGGNLGDREANLRAALEILSGSGCLVAVTSPLYETEPWGVEDQPRFLNAACGVDTRRPPHALLDLIKGIEWRLGRRPTVRHGPRTVDLDILLYCDLCIDTPRLVIPHPGMLERASVLIPLADIAGDIRHPVTGRTIADHRADLGHRSDVAPFPPGLGE
jgi:2-amino-4-hydroxy-6-hydroxymethyldihydropteridine diphosphokinase